MELKGGLFGVRFEPPRGEFRERRKLGLHARLFNGYVLGAFLVSGAWLVGKDLRSGRRFLAAAWAFMCGMAYYSFFEQVHCYQIGLSDPAPVSSGWGGSD